MLEEIFEKVGETIDIGINNLKKTAEDTKTRMKQSVKKSKNKVENMEGGLHKRLNKTFSRINVSDKDLSEFEKSIGNVAINLAHALEKGVKSVSKNIFCDPNELNTKYGKLGEIYDKNRIFKNEARDCLAYVKKLEKKLPTRLKLKKAILTDVVKTLSSNNDLILGYYLYGHLVKQHIPTDVEAKKQVIKKYLLSDTEKNYYEFEKEKTGDTNRTNKNNKK